MLEDFDAAVRYWQELAERQPGPQLYANLAISFFYQRDFPAAHRMYELAHASVPDDYRYLGHIGEVLFLHDAAAAGPYFQRAIALAERQLAINPGDSLTLAPVADRVRWFDPDTTLALT